jgi:hypothetical protein
MEDSNLVEKWVRATSALPKVLSVQMYMLVKPPSMTQETRICPVKLDSNQ